MCHEYADLMYAKHAAEKRAKEPVRETAPAPTPSAEPAGGLVAVLRGMVERFRPVRVRTAAE
jgi:hypothetical protein